jgi:hypothetical protein
MAGVRWRSRVRVVEVGQDTDDGAVPEEGSEGADEKERSGMTHQLVTRTGGVIQIKSMGNGGAKEGPRSSGTAERELRRGCRCGC